MYIVQEKKTVFYPNESFANFFRKNVGMSIEQAMSLSFALTTPPFFDRESPLKLTTIIDPKTFFKELIIGPKIINSIIENLTISFDNIKTKIIKELDVGDLDKIPLGYNLDIFRKTPLIKLPSGKLVCANLSCLLQKSTQNLIWLPKARISNLKKEEMDKLVVDLTNYRGRLFEEYVKYLCKVMESKNRKISFYYISPKSTTDNEEVADSILAQDDEIIILESKSRQFGEAFKYTGDWTRDEKFIEELIKKASEQIEIGAKKIIEGKVDKVSLKSGNIKRIYPIIVTYESIPMHAKMQRFIRQKIQEFACLTNPIFAPLEIVDIDDLENIIDSADKYTLIDLLREKNNNGSHASETNFNNFFSFFTKSHEVISNGWQRDEWNKFMENIFKSNLKFK